MEGISKQTKEAILEWVNKKKFRTTAHYKLLVIADDLCAFINSPPENEKHEELWHKTGWTHVDCTCTACIEVRKQIAKRLILEVAEDMGWEVGSDLTTIGDIICELDKEKK